MPDKVVMTYLGHSTFRLITETGRVILLDPFLEGNPQCPLQIDQVDHVDLILVTHGAFDHMGQAVELAISTGAILVSGPDVREYALAQGLPASQSRLLVWGGEIPVQDTMIRSLKADHLSFMKLGDGFVSSIAMSFLITTPGGISIYAMGDSAIFMDLQLFGRLYKPQVGLMPVGGFPGYFTEMSPREAALAANWLGVDLAVPVHYVDNPENGEIFRQICRQMTPQMRVNILEPGQELVLEPRPAIEPAETGKQSIIMPEGQSKGLLPSAGGGQSTGMSVLMHISPHHLTKPATKSNNGLKITTSCRGRSPLGHVASERFAVVSHQGRNPLLQAGVENVKGANSVGIGENAKIQVLLTHLSGKMK
eukprot:TRINITY_DN20889_c0_g2_i1.p1 TRINITY_DN20889_c0_g2~~TRINITY_DN20889_c0_g2_i1.p1  ORF type:complete len:365 (+),score=32.35 TRINITY_DN20889_c0_g2_i1:303-1397(+)